VKIHFSAYTALLIMIIRRFLADRTTVALLLHCCVCRLSSSVVCDVMYCG